MEIALLNSLLCVASRVCVSLFLLQIDLDPASFPTPEHPESTGRRQNLAANPNEFSIEQELQLIAQTKEGGETDPTSVQAEELVRV